MLFEVGKTTDIPEGEARRFTADRIDIAIANLGDGAFLALDDICSHAESSLSEGEVDIEDEILELMRECARLLGQRVRRTPASKPPSP